MIIEPNIQSNFLKKPRIETFEDMDVEKFKKENYFLEEQIQKLQKENETLKIENQDLKLELRTLEKKSKKGGE